jgi:hypothetical protein
MHNHAATSSEAPRLTSLYSSNRRAASAQRPVFVPQFSDVSVSLHPTAEQLATGAAEGELKEFPTEAQRPPTPFAADWTVAPSVGLSLVAELQTEFLLRGAGTTERRLQRVKNPRNGHWIDLSISAGGVEPITDLEHLRILLFDFGQLQSAIRMIFDGGTQLGIGPTGGDRIAADFSGVLPHEVGCYGTARGDELAQDVDMIGGVVSVGFGGVEIIRVAQGLGCGIALGQRPIRQTRPDQSCAHHAENQRPPHENYFPSGKLEESCARQEAVNELPPCQRKLTAVKSLKHCRSQEIFATTSWKPVRLSTAVGGTVWLIRCSTIPLRHIDATRGQ